MGIECELTVSDILIDRLAIVQVVKIRDMSTADMPTTLASTFKLDTTVKLK